MPDRKIDTYRSPGGFGVRLDVGNAYSGYAVTPRMRDRGNKTMKYIGEVTVNGFTALNERRKIF